MPQISPEYRPVSSSSNGRPTGPAPDRRKLLYDAGDHSLWVGRILVKKFEGPADVQELILQAIQEQDSEQRIDDPLPPKKGLDPKKRLHDAVRRLNQHQKTTLIRFHVTGRGTAITWERVT